MVFKNGKKIRIKKISIKKKDLKTFIHVNYIFGFLYAFYHFLRTPKSVDMATRRMWAYETWIIFTAYALFIYLFLLEISTEDGIPILFKLFKIKRNTIIKYPKDKVLSFFRSISNDPSKYEFDSHKGVTVVKGNLTKEGSIFQTKERFLIFPIKLTFEVTDVDTDERFEFRLIKPLKGLGIRGDFSIEELKEDRTDLTLSIYTHSKGLIRYIFLTLVFISPVRFLIAKQIAKEVEFIKTSVVS